MKKWLAVLLFVASLSACSRGLNGTYEDQSRTISYTFKPSGKVSMNMMGNETEMDYRLEDGKIKIGSPLGSLVMPILEDGSIKGPMGVKLVKKDK